jgi:hypothetical protein
LNADDDVEDGVYKTNGINPDVFISLEPYAYDAKYHGDEFVPPRIHKTFNKLMVDIHNKKPFCRRKVL